MADDTTIRTPPKSNRRGFLFRNRFVIYLFLIVAFIGWRIYRYYSWDKKRPDVFILYEKYQQENQPRVKSEVVLLSEEVSALRGVPDRTERLDALLESYVSRKDAEMVTSLVEIVRREADFAKIRDEKLLLYDWILNNFGNLEDAPERAHLSAIQAALGKDALLENEEEKRGLLDKIVARHDSRMEPRIRVQLTQVKFNMAGLIDDKVEKVRLYDEVLATLEQYPDRMRPWELVRMAHAKNLKAHNTTNREKKLALLEQVIATNNESGDFGMMQQVLWAIERKAEHSDQEKRAAVYKQIIERYKDVNVEHFQSAVARARDKLEPTVLENDG